MTCPCRSHDRAYRRPQPMRCDLRSARARKRRESLRPRPTRIERAPSGITRMIGATQRVCRPNNYMRTCQLRQHASLAQITSSGSETSIFRLASWGTTGGLSSLRVYSLRVLSLRVLSLRVLSLKVLSYRVLSLRVLSLRLPPRVSSLRVLSLRVISLEVLSLRVYPLIPEGISPYPSGLRP